MTSTDFPTFRYAIEEILDEHPGEEPEHMAERMKAILAKRHKVPVAVLKALGIGENWTSDILARLCREGLKVWYADDGKDMFNVTITRASQLKLWRLGYPG